MNDLEKREADKEINNIKSKKDFNDFLIRHNLKMVNNKIILDRKALKREVDREWREKYE